MHYYGASKEGVALSSILYVAQYCVLCVETNIACALVKYITHNKKSDLYT